MVPVRAAGSAEAPPEPRLVRAASPPRPSPPEEGREKAPALGRFGGPRHVLETEKTLPDPPLHPPSLRFGAASRRRGRKRWPQGSGAQSANKLGWKGPPPDEPQAVAEPAKAGTQCWRFMVPTRAAG